VDGASADLPATAALREQCLVEQRRGDGTATAEEWTAVAARWHTLARPYPAAYAHLRAAETAVDRGERAAAGPALRTAHRTAIALGAVPLRDEIEALARATRLELAEPGARPVRSVEQAPFGLTPREREVLALLCAGLTNRQIARSIFITERTAGVHVSNIIMRMQVANRGQAAALARRTGICGDALR
jgi:DNA-binding CsgD family transcriptional regulator